VSGVELGQHRPRQDYDDGWRVVDAAERHQHHLKSAWPAVKQLPPAGANERDRDFAIRQLIDGRNNAVGTVTLTASVTTTVVTRTNANANGYVFLMPLTATAAGALATTYILAANITKTGFTITHANAVSVDRTFAYVMLGGG
jgi:hypothetical protein